MCGLYRNRHSADDLMSYPYIHKKRKDVFINGKEVYSAFEIS